MHTTRRSFLILTPVICLLALITNILIIVTTKAKRNRKELNGFKHYDYMRLNAIINTSILVIQLFSLMNDCPPGFGCVQISHYVVIQLYKIIFHEFVSNVLRFLANITCMGFSLCRLGLIGNEHIAVVRIMTEEASIKACVGYSLLVGVPLCVVKIFGFRLNNNEPMVHQYPYRFVTPFSFDTYPIETQIFIFFDFLCDLINYMVFIVLIIIVDVYTVVKLKRTVGNKMKSCRKNFENVGRVLVAITLGRVEESGNKVK